MKGLLLYSGKPARKLIDMGFKKVYVLRNGLPGWSEAGYPVEPKDVNACFAGQGKRTASHPQEAAYPA